MYNYLYLVYKIYIQYHTFQIELYNQNINKLIGSFRFDSITLEYKKINETNLLGTFICEINGENIEI